MTALLCLCFRLGEDQSIIGLQSVFLEFFRRLGISVSFQGLFAPSQHLPDLLDQIDLRVHDFLLLRAIDNCHAQLEADRLPWVAWLASLEQCKIFLQGCDSVQLTQHEVADLQIVVDDVELVGQDSRPGQQYAPAVRGFICLLSHEEAFLTRRAEQCEHNLANLVLLQSYDLQAPTRPLEVDELGYEEIDLTDIGPQWKLE